MTEKTHATVRVLVAFDAWRHDAEALEMAAGMAARRQAELLALFIEDINLMNLAELPFATEIDRFCAVERRLDRVRVARHLRARAAQLRGLIDELSERLQVSGSLKILRGHYIAVALAAAADMDILLLGKRTVNPRPASYLQTRYESVERQRRALVGEPVWVIFDGSPAAARALIIASELAVQGGCELAVILPARSDTEAARWRRHIAELANFNALAARMVLIPPDDAAGLVHLVRRAGCGLLVAKRDEDEVIRMVAENAGCPLVLVV